MDIRILGAAVLPLCLIGFFVSPSARAESQAPVRAPDLPPTEDAVRAAEAEAKSLQQELTDARHANRKLAKRREAFGITADLISGRRATPPTLQVVEKEVLRLCEKPVTLDNRADGSRLIWNKWVTLKDGCRYRVRAKIGIREISGTKNFKYGMMVTRPGKDCDWPAAFVGGAPFDEREISFDYFCPVGGRGLFVIGFESGKGVAEFHDVRFCELKEVLK